jgi:hypothetical protein
MATLIEDLESLLREVSDTEPTVGHQKRLSTLSQDASRAMQSDDCTLKTLRKMNVLLRKLNELFNASDE